MLISLMPKKEKRSNKITKDELFFMNFSKVFKKKEMEVLAFSRVLIL